MSINGQEIESFIREQLPPEKYGFRNILTKSQLQHDHNGFYVAKEDGIEDGYDCFGGSLTVRQAFSSNGTAMRMYACKTKLFDMHFVNAYDSMGEAIAVDVTPFYRRYSDGSHISSGYISLADEDIQRFSNGNRVRLTGYVPLSHRQYNGIDYLSLVSVASFITAYGEKQRVSIETDELAGIPPKRVRTIRNSVFLRQKDIDNLVIVYQILSMK